MPLDAHQKDAQNFLDSLDNEPDLQMALLKTCAKLGPDALVTGHLKKIRFELSPTDAEFLCSLIGDLILDEIDRQPARKIYRAMLRAGINDEV